jgi:hypothetical protein
MKRTRQAHRTRLTREAEQLVRLATGLANSGSRTEDRFWEQRLAAQVEKMLKAGNEDAVGAAQEHLYSANMRACDELADALEAYCEGARISTAEGEFEVLLIAVPVLAWSRFVVPTGTIPSAALNDLRVHLQAHVLAAGTRLGLADSLFSIDQLPRGFCPTLALARDLWAAAAAGKNLRIDPRQMPETANFIADSRYLLGAVAAPPGGPHFRWQESDATRESVDAQWRAQGGQALPAALPACAFELLLPDAFFTACRNADRELRPYSLRAGAAFLQTSCNLEASALKVVLAPFQEHDLMEFRVSFAIDESGEVAHGVVWPLLEGETDAAAAAAEIEAVLREAGVGEILTLEQTFPFEYCDDCGAPLFPNATGEAVHVEAPEDGAGGSGHLH